MCRSCSHGSDRPCFEPAADRFEPAAAWFEPAAAWFGPAAGDNPQIAKGDGREPVQAYLDALPEWKGEIGRHLDALIIAAVPDVRQAVRWNSPFYGIERRGWFFSMHCMTKYVQVTWLNGGELDPPPPKTSKYPRVRYSNICQGDPIDDDQFRDWIRQAVAIPGDETF